MVKGGAFTKHKHKHQRGRVEYVGDPSGRDVDRQVLHHTGKRPVSGGSRTGKPTRRGGKLVRAKSHKARKILESRESKVVENPKKMLVLRGNKCGRDGTEALKDMIKMKDADVIKLSRKNAIYPFEDASELEGLAGRKDASMFIMANHSKKRPNNLICGRLFGGQMYDMVEFGMENFKGIQEIRQMGKAGVVAFSKPCMMFQGAEFEYSLEMKQVKSMLLDLFKGRDVEGVNLIGVDRVIVITATSDKTVKLRHYWIRKGDKDRPSSSSSSSSTTSPAVTLVELGPRMDLTLRRNQLPDRDVEKQAFKVPQELKSANKKNITQTSAAEMGRVHMQRQDLKQVALKKMKTFKRQKNLRKLQEKDNSEFSSGKRSFGGMESSGGGDDQQPPVKRGKF